MKNLTFLTFMFVSSYACANGMEYECPHDIVVVQEHQGAAASQFEVSNTNGRHELISGYVGYYTSDTKKGDKSSLIYRVAGISADEVNESHSLSAQRYLIDKEFFGERKARFFCIYEDTSVTLSVLIPLNVKECVMSVKEKDPALSQAGFVKFECVK
ncbi:hypothetical protein D0C16_20585 [Cellvibrio sp. KY-GH-1]|uniref:STY0301 family protein n=1 Tax=Cellvibrio sp. KY-GH-1 TaxID=2303332 RepID=UPI0012443E2B|nr:STY0301 family protein [Cellvibrio sp. KY-GH-1]QEY18172.1 hypothetical protein D0C16_20585 [Cellvibrio sp. KY-GH-1]